MIFANDVLEVDDVLVLEPGQDLDLPQRPLAVGLVLERHHLLDGHLLASDAVDGRDHHTVRALAQKLERMVAGTNLKQIEKKSSKVPLKEGQYMYQFIQLLINKLH